MKAKKQTKNHLRLCLTPLFYTACFFLSFFITIYSKETALYCAPVLEISNLDLASRVFKMLGLLASISYIYLTYHHLGDLEEAGFFKKKNK